MCAASTVLSSLNSLQIPNLVKSKAPLEKVETWLRWHVSLNTGYIKRQFWNRWERRMVVTPSLLLLVIPFFILATESCVSFRNPPRVQAVCLCVYLGDCAYLQAFGRVHTTGSPLYLLIDTVRKYKLNRKLIYKCVTRPSILCVTHQMSRKKRNYSVGWTVPIEMMN